MTSEASQETKSMRFLATQDVPPLLRGRYAETEDSILGLVPGADPQDPNAPTQQETFAVVNFWFFHTRFLVPEVWLTPVAPDEAARVRYAENLLRPDVDLVKQSISSALDEMDAVRQELPKFANPYMALLDRAILAQSDKDLLDLPWKSPLTAADQKSLLIAWKHLERALSGLAIKEKELVAE